MPGNTLSCSLRFAPTAGAALLMLACTAALAAPEGGPDAVGRFLAEKGLVEVPASPLPDSGFVDRVRDKTSDMVLAAMNFLGVPYRRGGNDDEGFDCSGFTRHIFEMSLGLALPRRVDDQATAPGLFAVKRAELQPGDLVFFNTLKRTFSHVGIYIGENRFIHSPRSGGQVRVEDMRYAYWSKRFTGARRAAPLREAAAAPVQAPATGAAAQPRAVNAAETARFLY